MKILVIRGGALGDFLLTLPAVAGLRENWPEATLEMVAAKKFGSLVVGPGAVDDVRPIDQPGLAGFYATGGTLDPDWCDYFSEFDLTISYLFDPDEIFARNWRRGGGTGQYLGMDPRNPTEPAWRYLARPLRELGLEPGDASCLYGRDLLPSSDKPQDQAKVSIHPGSGSPKKNWPLSHWVEVMEYGIGLDQAEVTWLSGEVEGDLLQKLPEKWKSPPHRLVQQQPLPEVFRALRESQLYLGHDSGISHLAAWSGVKCGLLFGPTDPKIWAPRGSQVNVWNRSGGWPPPADWAEWLRGLVNVG